MDTKVFDWHSTDCVCIITVEGSEARLERSLKRLEQIGLARERITIIKDIPRPDKKRAIWNNHRRAWQHICEHAPKRGLVFEDDVVASKHLTPAALARLSKWIDNHSEAFDAFFLGHWPTANLKPISENVVKATSLLAHAYIMPSAIAKKIVAIEPPLGKAVDMDLLRHFPNAHAVYPMFFYQEEDVSTNTGRKQIINLREANQFIEEAAFKQNLYPSLRAPLSYLELLKIARGRVNLGAELKQALLDVPHMVREAVRNGFKSKPPYL